MKMRLGPEKEHYFQTLASLGVGELPLQVRAPAALPEDLGLVPSSHMTAHSISNSSPSSLFWPPWVLHAYGAHIHRGKTSIYTKYK